MVTHSVFSLFDQLGDAEARRALPWHLLPGRLVARGPAQADYEEFHEYLRSSGSLRHDRGRVLEALVSPQDEEEAVLFTRPLRGRSSTASPDPDEPSPSQVRAVSRGEIDHVLGVWRESYEDLLSRVPVGVALADAEKSARSLRRPGSGGLERTRSGRIRRPSSGRLARVTATTLEAVAVEEEPEVRLGRALGQIQQALARLEQHRGDVALVRSGDGVQRRVTYHATALPFGDFYTRYGYAKRHFETPLAGPSIRSEDAWGLCWGCAQNGLRVKMLERFLADGEGGDQCVPARVELSPKEISTLLRELEAVDAVAWNAIRERATDRNQLDQWEEFLRGMWSLLPRAIASGKVLCVAWTEKEPDRW